MASTTTTDVRSALIIASVFVALRLERSDLLDRKNRLLFSGDTLVRGHEWWLHLKCRAEPDVCFATYERLGTLSQAVTQILTPHGDYTLPGEFLTAAAAGMARIREGKVAGKSARNFGGEGIYYDLGGYGPIFKTEIGA